MELISLNYRPAGIALPWAGCALIIILFMAGVISDPYGLLIPIAFFLLGLPIQDPYLRIIVYRKVESPIKTHLTRLEANASDLTKLESKVTKTRDEFFKTRYLQDNIRADILKDLEDMSNLLENLNELISDKIQSDFIKWEHFIENTRRRVNR